MSQMAPEKAQPVGVLMETVVGTGKWPYDGLPINPPIDITVNQLSGGSVYLITGILNIPTRTTGLGAGLEVSWTNFREEAPFMVR